MSPIVVGSKRVKLSFITWPALKPNRVKTACGRAAPPARSSGGASGGPPLPAGGEGIFFAPCGSESLNRSQYVADVSKEPATLCTEWVYWGYVSYDKASHPACTGGACDCASPSLRRGAGFAAPLFDRPDLYVPATLYSIPGNTSMLCRLRSLSGSTSTVVYLKFD